MLEESEATEVLEVSEGFLWDDVMPDVVRAKQ